MFIKYLKLALFLLLFFPAVGYSQPRHVQGQEMKGVIFSITDNQQLAGIVYQRYLSELLSYKIIGDYQHIKFNTTNYNNFSINPELLVKLLSNKKNIFLNFKAGLFVGSGFAKSPIVNDHRLYMGEGVGFNTEIYLLPKFKLDFDLEQNFYQRAYFAHYMYAYKISLLFSL